MKYSFIFLILAALIGYGCESVLDKDDLTAVNESEAWNDLKLATAYISNVYADNLPGWSDDEADWSDESDEGGSYMYGQLTENSVNYWPYDQIREINVLLNSIDQGTLEESEKNQLKGEAYFFRAWRYFEMFKRYGGVPLVLEPQKLTDDLLVRRNSVQETYDQIISDLDDAIEHLPVIEASSDDNTGRVHKGTAMALKGRVTLYWASPQFDPGQEDEGRWQAAYNVNKAAIEQLESNGYGLYSSFAGLWFNEMNKEAIFVHRYERPQEVHRWSAASRPLDVSQGATGANWPVLEMVRAFPMKDGKAIDDPTSAYAYDENYFWQNRDPRFDATIAYNGSLWELEPVGPGRIQWTYSGGESNNPTQTGFYMRKAVDITQDAYEAYESNTDWIEIRFAEVLLNFAEAANKVGKQDEAYDALKRIRQRAGIDSGDDNLYGLKPGMHENEMFEAILLERKIELAYEGKRHWDLRRHRLFESLLNGTVRHGFMINRIASNEEWSALMAKRPSEIIDELNANYTNYFSHSEISMDPLFEINWQDEYYFYAIPSEHLQLNSNLEQTEGWPGGTFEIPGAPQ